MNALLWFTLKYTFHRFQLTLVVLSIMTYKREKKRNLFIYFHVTETQKYHKTCQNLLKYIIVTQLLILSVLWIKGGGKTTFQSLKFPSYKAYSLFYIFCTFVYKYIHFK